MTSLHAIRSALSLLSRRDRRLLSVSTAIQMSTSLLDLIGVLLVGLVGALAVTTVQSQPPPQSVADLADALGIETLSSQELTLLLATSAAVVLLVKSVLSAYLNRRVFAFLANRQALVSARLATELFEAPVTFIQSRTSQETIYALITGTSAATMQILGQAVIVASESALLLVIGIAAFVLSPIVALACIAFFGTVALLLHRAMGSWASRLGHEYADTEMASMDVIRRILSVYREVTVTNRRFAYVRDFQDLRWRASKLAADTQFIALLPKYLFDAALVLGGFLLAAFLFSTQDSIVAVGTLALFLAAASRVMPSMLRLQGAVLILRSAAGTAKPAFDLADDLRLEGDHRLAPTDESSWHNSAAPVYHGAALSLALSGVTYSYPGGQQPAVKDVFLNVAAGSSVALVGRSGSGKSTLADLVLGVLTPQQGTVKIGGQDPRQVRIDKPGSLGYVPQGVSVISGTIRDNVALGIPRHYVADQDVWDALRQAHLGDFVSQLPEQLDAQVGEDGVRLSGGQRQRLGIARALFSKPGLVVLDEATSALDAETEAALAGTLQAMAGAITAVVIAHRLSTVRNADLVVYLEDGRILAHGDFSSVRRRVPALDKQASLMGL